MKQRQIVRQGRRVTLLTCGLLMSVWSLQSCKDDDLILTGQPSWLGNSIYERLEDEGNYKYTLRLIDDLGEKEVLSHTGSRTLFVASDSAYDVWFKKNGWGVSRYEDLNTPQKKLLLKNSMISNAYLLELMSNKKAEGDAATPEWGRTMRRETSSSYFDSVYVMPVSEMPETKYWEKFRQRGHGMPILKDATEAPMIHFLPAYLQNNKITAEDLNVLTNGRATSINEAWVNGVKVVNSGDPSRKKIDYDITCKNGYIQKVENVIEYSPNMAELIKSDPNTQTWSRLLDRFSAPYYYDELSKRYNNTFGKNDSLFVLRYLSKNMWRWSASGGTREVANYPNTKIYDPDGNPVDATELLSYDPGWNQYILDNTDIDMHADAGMMIVPTDQAMDEWWNGSGKELQDEYIELDSVPTNIIAELINVNMLSRFSSFVPSKFGSVLNDAKEPLGIKKEDVVGCYMGCNGVIYKTNKVFTPALFSSVAYPALAHASDMNIIYYVIDNRNFKPYLLSMDSKYALILPHNDAMLYYLDPSSYGNSTQDDNGEKVETPDIIEISYNNTTKQIKADRYSSFVSADGEITKDKKTQSNVATALINKLFDSMMDQLIIVIPDQTKTLEDYIREGYHYFKTKGGSIVKASIVDGTLAFQGGWQMEHNRDIMATGEYVKDNGKSYTVYSQVPMGAQNTVYTTLQAHPEFSSFLTILENDYNNLLSQKLSNKYNAGMAKVGNKNLRLLDNYNYTVYVPTNAAIQNLQDNGYLPTDAELDRGDYDPKTGADPVLDSICDAKGWYKLTSARSTADSLEVRKKVAAAMTTIVSDFVRYHVQDRSLAIGMAHETGSDGSYESMKRNLETGKFYPITVDYDAANMTVTDALNNSCHVVKTGGLYNLICREYWFEGTGTAARLFMASDVVVHQIDGVLKYETMRKWTDIVEEALTK